MNYDYDIELEFINNKLVISNQFEIDLETIILENLDHTSPKEPYFLELEIETEYANDFSNNPLYELELEYQESNIDDNNQDLYSYYDIELEYDNYINRENYDLFEIELIEEKSISIISKEPEFYEIECVYEDLQSILNKLYSVYEVELIETTESNNLNSENVDIEIELLFSDSQVIEQPISIEVPSNNIINTPIVPILEKPPIIYKNINLNDINELIIGNTTQDDEKKNMIESILKDWYANEEIKYHRLINLRENQWYNISISNIFFDSYRRDLPTFLNKFDITKTYLLNENGYQNLMDSSIFNKYFNNTFDIYTSLTNNYYIPSSLSNLNDSCFIKKSSKNISCLLIGINYSNDHLSKLEGPERDANALEVVLKEYYKDRINIVKLTENMDSDKKPTYENIKREMDILISKSSTDNIMFYYAGHIGQQEDANKDEDDRLDEYLILLNNVHLTDDWFYHNFTKKLDKDCKCRLYFDSCHSQGFCDFPINIKKTGEFEIVRNNSDQLANIVCITSSKEYQRTYEVFNDISGQYEGVFTNKLVESINTVGNFDLLYSFRLIDLKDPRFTQDIAICTTYTFDRESILLL